MFARSTLKILGLRVIHLRFEDSEQATGKKKDSLFDRVVMHCTFVLHVFVSYSCFIFIFHIHISYSCFIFMFHIRVPYSCSLFILRFLFMSFLHFGPKIPPVNVGATMLSFCVSGPWLHSVGCFGWRHHNYNPFWHVKHRGLAEVFCLLTLPETNMTYM